MMGAVGLRTSYKLQPSSGSDPQGAKLLAGSLWDIDRIKADHSDLADLIVEAHKALSGKPKDLDALKASVSYLGLNPTDYDREGVKRLIEGLPKDKNGDAVRKILNPLLPAKDYKSKYTDKDFLPVAPKAEPKPTAPVAQPDNTTTPVDDSSSGDGKLADGAEGPKEAPKPEVDKAEDDSRAKASKYKRIFKGRSEKGWGFDGFHVEYRLSDLAAVPFGKGITAQRLPDQFVPERTQFGGVAPRVNFSYLSPDPKVGNFNFSVEFFVDPRAASASNPQAYNNEFGFRIYVGEDPSVVVGRRGPGGAGFLGINTDKRSGIGFSVSTVGHVYGEDITNAPKSGPMPKLTIRDAANHFSFGKGAFVMGVGMFTRDVTFSRQASDVGDVKQDGRVLERHVLDLNFGLDMRRTGGADATKEDALQTSSDITRAMVFRNVFGVAHSGLVNYYYALDGSVGTGITAGTTDPDNMKLGVSLTAFDDAFIGFNEGGHAARMGRIFNLGGPLAKGLALGSQGAVLLGYSVGAAVYRNDDQKGQALAVLAVGKGISFTLTGLSAIPLPGRKKSLFDPNPFIQHGFKAGKGDAAGWLATCILLPAASGLALAYAGKMTGDTPYLTTEDGNPSFHGIRTTEEYQNSDEPNSVLRPFMTRGRMAQTGLAAVLGFSLGQCVEMNVGWVKRKAAER